MASVRTSPPRPGFPRRSPPCKQGAGNFGESESRKAPFRETSGNFGKAEPLDLGEGIAALAQENEALRATALKLSRLADAALRRLAPEERAAAFREAAR